MLFYPPGLEFVSALYGCLYAGIIAVPVYPPRLDRLVQSWQDLNHVVADCQPKVALTTTAMEGMIAGEKDGRRGEPFAVICTDRPVDGALPVHSIGDAERLVVGGKNRDGRQPLFYALPADAKSPPQTTTPLYEFVNKTTGRRAYVTQRSWKRAGFQRREQPICLIWKSPYSPNEGSSK